jgi:hypothetical protein
MPVDPFDSLIQESGPALIWAGDQNILLSNEREGETENMWPYIVSYVSLYNGSMPSKKLTTYSINALRFPVHQIQLEKHIAKK